MNSVMKSESATKEAQALKQLLCLSPPLRALGKFVTANNESFAPHKFILVLMLSRGWNPQQLPTPTTVRIALVVRGRLST